METERTNGQRGATILEFTVLFPLLVLLTLGLIDLGFLMLTAAEANRATQVGARFAVANPPVAQGVNNPIVGTSGAEPGDPCIDPRNGTSTNACVIPPEYTCSVSAVSGVTTRVCKSAAGKTLPFSTEWFGKLRDEMAKQFLSRKLDERSIVIKYKPLELGYVGHSDTPMQVTVSLRCLSQPLIFVGGFLRFALPPVSGECAGLRDPISMPLPEFSTSLLGEDMQRLPGEDFGPR